MIIIIVVVVLVIYIGMVMDAVVIITISIIRPRWLQHFSYQMSCWLPNLAMQAPPAVPTPPTHQGGGPGVEWVYFEDRMLYTKTWVTHYFSLWIDENGYQRVVRWDLSDVRKITQTRPDGNRFVVVEDWTWSYVV